MKEKVELSTFSFILTIITIIVLIGGFITQYKAFHNETIVWIMLIVMLIWGFSVLFYSPLFIELSDNSLSVHRSIRIKEFPFEEISSVEMWPPTMGVKRICGSGGWFGYWGWFSDRLIGKYFAYHGKASDCFLITLKSGKKYLLGCKNASCIVDNLKNKL